ncbi:MAG: aldo/keto reductase [Phycisphaerae bacterium]|nr:aldo/keto reductase [Phycisphaerae bacterium]
MSATRREFLKSALATGAAAQMAAGASSSTSPAKPGDMPRRILGRTKEQVTIVGLGCAYAGGGVSEAQTRETVETALAGGIRYFDAAPEYVAAEVRLAPVIKPVRNECFLVTKTYARTAKEAEKDLATALKQLQVDHVDLFLQHAVGIQPVQTNTEILGKGGSLEFMTKAKAKGLCRFIGMSVHPPHAAAIDLLEKSDAYDVVMPFMSYLAHAQLEAEDDDIDFGGADAYDRQELLPLARKKNLGIVGMKVLGGHPGKLAEDYDRAVRYALSVPGLASAVIGVVTPEHVKRAVQVAKTFRPMTEPEMKATLDKGAEMVRKKVSASNILYRHWERDFGSIRTA